MDTHTTEELWARAKKVFLVRSMGTGLLASALMFVLALVDLDHWPPRWDATPSYRLAVVMAILMFAVFVLVEILQSRRSSQRYISPLLGLSGPERKQAMADIRAGRPSPDAVLREAEVMRCRQLTMPAMSDSLGAALAPGGFQLVVAVLMFASGSPLAGLLWITLAAYGAVNGYRAYRLGPVARRFLGRTSSEGSSMTHASPSMS